MGPVADAFLVGAAAAGVSRLGGELVDILALGAAHGQPALVAALGRAVEYRRWRAADIRSILATAGVTAPYERYVGDMIELAAAVRGETKLRVTYDEDLMVHEALLRASGMF